MNVRGEIIRSSTGDKIKQKISIMILKMGINKSYHAITNVITTKYTERYSVIIYALMILYQLWKI